MAEPRRLADPQEIAARHGIVLEREAEAGLSGIPFGSILRRIGVQPGADLQAEASLAAEVRRLNEAQLCPLCKGMGWVMSAARPEPCACTLREWRTRYLASLPVSGPLVEDQHNRHVMAAVREYTAGRGLPWFVLAGPPGRGKTALGLQVLRLRAEAEAPQMGVFRRTVDLLSWFKEGMDPEARPDLEARIGLASGWPLLLLDDLGSHQRTEWSWTVLKQLLDARERLETIITLESMIGLPEHLASRLQNHRTSWCFVLGGPDRRREKA